MPLKEGKLKISQSVLSLFFNIASPPTHLRTHVDTQMGFFVDGECVLERRNSSQLRPVEIMGMQGLGIPLDQVPAVKENQYRLERVLITALTCRMLHKVTTALFDQITILVYEINFTSPLT